MSNRMLSGNSRCLHGAPSSRRIRGSVFCLRPERSSVSKRFTCPELRSVRAGGFYESATESFYSRTAKQRHDSPWEVNIWLFQDSIVGVFSRVRMRSVVSGRWSVCDRCCLPVEESFCFFFLLLCEQQKEGTLSRVTFLFVNTKSLGYMCETLPSGSSVRNERAAGPTNTGEKRLL